MNDVLEHRGRISPDSTKMLVQVILAPPGWWANKEDFDSAFCHRVQALVDTGAEISGISEASIEQLRLFPLNEKKWFVSADQATEQPLYQVDVGIMLPTVDSLKKFHHVSVREVFENKQESIDEGRTQMLIGMDIILHGILHVEDKRFCFGFDPQPYRPIGL